MLPLNFDSPVLDDLGKIHTLTEYIVDHGGGEPTPISDSIVEFTSDDTIQNPTERIAMPLFQSGNALKDLMRWISKAFQNIRYILKYMDEISDDLNTTIEKVDDAAAYTAKEWTDITVAVAGEYYRYNNEIWKCLITNAHSPSTGSDWKKVLILDEVSELNSNLSAKFGFEKILDTNISSVNGAVTVPSDAKMAVVTCITDGGARCDTKVFIMPHNYNTYSSFVYLGSLSYYFIALVQVNNRTFTLKERSEGSTYINIKAYK